MMFRKFSYLLAVIFLFSLIESAFANPIEIHWWHAMRGARGEVVQKIVDDFNKSQSDYKVIATYKGEYDEVLNAAIAAVRAGKQPHIIQVFEVGTQTMMMSGMIYPVYKLMDDYGYKIDWSRYLQPVLSYYVNEDNKLKITDSCLCLLILLPLLCIIMWICLKRLVLAGYPKRIL